MKITFSFKSSESENVGAIFRLALVRAYAAQLVQLIANGKFDETALKEIEQAGELKVFILSVGDATDAGSEYAKTHPNEIHFKHFTNPPVFEEPDLRSPGLSYPILVKGEYREGKVILNLIDKRHEYESFPERLHQHPESDYQIRYSVDISNDKDANNMMLLFENETSYLHRGTFPHELFTRVQKFIPPSVNVTQTSIMYSFKQTIDQEVKRLEAKGSASKAIRLKLAKERALQAFANDETVSFDTLYKSQIKDKESVETIARSGMVNVGRTILHPLKKSVSSSWNNLFNSPNSKSLEEYYEQQELKNKQKKLELIRQKYNTVTDTEENILLAREEIQKQNRAESDYGII